MKDRFETTSQLELNRRDMLRYAAGLAAGAAIGVPGSAAAAGGAVTAFGITTAALKDWSVTQRSLGITVTFLNSTNELGPYLRDIIDGRMGDKADFFVFEGGTQDILGPQGLYAVLDEKRPELRLWARTPDVWKRSEVVRGKDGKQYGVPVIGNADSFGYFPDKLGVKPDGTEDISWGTFFEGDRVRGHVAYDRTWNYSIGVAALYLKSTGKANIQNPADPTAPEAKAVVDYLVARKKAGQFRTLCASFEEQIQLLSNREVDIINCWEPAVHEANNHLGPNTVFYAYTVEGYFKWGHGAYVSGQAMQRNNLPAIYTVLNYFMDGEYRALQARDRGYAGPNMDLGVAYAQQHGWSPEAIEGLKQTDAKVARKFAKPFVSTSAPSHADVIEEEWQRFLNA